MTDTLTPREAISRAVESWCGYPMTWTSAQRLLDHMKDAGYVVVPVEPTEAMLNALREWPHSYVHGPKSCYRAMLAARPGAGER